MSKLIKGVNDLATINPELAKEWHHEKNGDLKPADVTAGSPKKVWWLLPYDDSKTGKHFDFEWTATISSRNNGIGCPFLSGSAVWSGFNDLETVRPDLAKQWHPTKNGNLKPTNVITGSHKKVWWLLPYDDPKTNKHFNFEWQAEIRTRDRGIGCPFLSGNSVWSGFNDLETVRPDLAKQWHPTKNGDLKPTDVTAGSNKKVWWLLPYDTEDGRHFDFEWETTVYNRNNDRMCPYLSNPMKAVWSGFNDLATTNPDLAKQWHPTKNGELKPTDVTANSGLKVWWLLPYDDSVTGQHFDFEWETTIANRSQGDSCPFLSNPAKVIYPGFNDLATINPKLASQWHPTKNGNLKPTDVFPYSTKKVWWLLPYDTEDGRHFDFEWEATVYNRNNDRMCPYLSGRAVWQGFNDLVTINPELVKEWNYEKNYPLKPEDFTANSNQKVWWLYPYDDSKTGKHFDFEWVAEIADRNKSIGCPFLSGKMVCQGFNDLVTINPELAKQWHPTKNGNLKPTDVTAGSDKKVWWLLPYDDTKTGKHFDFEWQATISNRNYGKGCPYISASNAEQLVYSLMTKQKINFQVEKKFKDCKDKNMLPFDVYLTDLNIIIECDGIQHFKPINCFGGKEHFKITKLHDNIKNEYCKNNNIPILRIPYIYDSVVDKQKIESFVMNFIKTKTVPQEILDYYSQYKFNNYAKCAMELNNKIKCN